MALKFFRCLLCMVLPLVCTVSCASAPSPAATNASAAMMPRGSFIQSHLCMDWDDARWQSEFGSMREAGMDFIILMTTVDTDTAGVTRAIYPTAIEGIQPSPHDLVEACLRNAKNAGMKVMVGLNFDEHWWRIADGSSPVWLEQRLLQGNEIAAEIMRNYFPRYSDVISGWYWVWEIEPSFCANPIVMEVLTQALNVNLDFLHSLKPSLPVMLSPFMNCSLGDSDNCARVWKQILTNAHFADGDIFAPQDCIGSGYLTPDCVEEWFSKLHDIIPANPAVRFWANIELFDQRFWTSADVGRVKRQHDVLAPYVDGFISFAYSHYVSPHYKNPALHRAYCEWVRSGELEVHDAPHSVSGLCYADGMLKWNAVVGNEWLMGYRVRRDGVLVADIQLNRQGDCRCSVGVTQTGEYSVTAYDVWGVESLPAILIR